MPTFELPPLQTHVDRTYLDQLLEARKEGLQELSTTNGENDNGAAQRLRAMFKSEVVVPFLSPYANLASNDLNQDPGYQGTTGYLIGIDAFLSMYQAFRNCEAVQICFGMDKPVEEGGQIQLVFRGYQNAAHDASVFVTALPLGFYQAGELIDIHPVGAPRVCPTATSC